MRRSSLWSVMLMLVIVACAPAVQPSPAPGESPLATPRAVETPQPSPAVEPTPEIPPTLPTSVDLIAQALAAGEIDYETSLLYRIYAVFGDPRLPEEFSSDFIFFDAGTALFAEIIANQEQLSQETLEALAPFLARPNDPISIFNQDLSAARTGLSAPPQAATWQSLPAAQGRARVWVRSADPDEAEFLLAGYAEAVNDIWPHLRDLFRLPIADEASPPYQINPDDAIDIYFLPLGMLNPRDEECRKDPKLAGCKLRKGIAGLAILDDPFRGNTSSGYLLIDVGLGGDELVGTMAHELFHLSQDAYDFHETSWLFESTATWGEFRILQELERGLEPTHTYLPLFFWTLDVYSLGDDEGLQEYGAYLYSFFAQMEEGDAIVRAFWEEASAEGAQGLSAIDQRFPFRDHFHEFALRNWNQEPVTPRYKEADNQFPDLTPLVPKNDELTLVPDQAETLDIELLLLTARYFKITVSDDDIRKVTISLEDITGNPDGGVDAIVTIAGEEPEVRYWSDQPEVIFCMDQPDQELQDLILIVSNANLSAPLQGQIEIEPSTQQCEMSWHGTIKFTYEYNLTQTESGEGYSNQTIWIITGEGETNFVESDLVRSGYLGLESYDWQGQGTATANYTYNSESHEVETGCTTDAYFSESGNGQATEEAGVTLIIYEQGYYELSFGFPSIEFPTQYSSNETATGSGEFCSGAGSFSASSTQYWSSDAVPSFIEGQMDPADPNLITGTITWTDPLLEPAGIIATSTVSWVLTRTL